VAGLLEAALVGAAVAGLLEVTLVGAAGALPDAGGDEDGVEGELQAASSGTMARPPAATAAARRNDRRDVDA